MADLILPNNFELRTEYVWNITDLLKEDLDKDALRHITNWQDSYLKKYIDKKDAEVHFHLRVEKVKGDRYECKFHCKLDGVPFDWANDQPFKSPHDVVNHAFKHLKEKLSHK